MNPLFSFAKNAEISKAYDKLSYDLGYATAMLKTAAVKTNALSGELYASTDGTVALSVPNSLVRGAFDAIDENGLNLPGKDNKFNAHIVVFTQEELRKIGGSKKVSERGHHFHYNLGPLYEASVTNSMHHSRVWYLSVVSPELVELRKSYGLDSSPGNNGFHIVVALRKIGVLGNNKINKQAASYIATGNVQGVGFREKLHKLLNDENLPGLGVNNPYNHSVEVNLPIDDAKADDVINRLKKLLDKGEAGSGNYQIEKSKVKDKLVKMVMDKKLIDRFTKRQGFTKLQAETDDYRKQWLTDRYRLKPEGDAIVGEVPVLASRQLKGLEPVYSKKTMDDKGYDNLSTPYMDKAWKKHELLNAMSKIQNQPGPDKPSKLPGSIEDSNTELDTEADTPLGSNTTPMLGKQ
jgi:acylphosphatase